MSDISIPKFGMQDDRLWHYRAFVIRVIDGDTAVLYVDKGMQTHEVMKVRLAGIDAPEMRPRKSSGPSSQVAAEKVLAERATSRLKELIEGREIVIKTQKTGKFGRWLAEVYLPEDMSKTANQLLLDEGLVVRYGDPRPWRNE